MSDSFINMISTMGLGESTAYITINPRKAREDVDNLVKTLEPKRFTISQAQYSSPSANKAKIVIVRVE